MTSSPQDRTHPNLTLAVLALGGMAYAMLSSAVVPALPTMQHDLGTSETGITWLLTGYLLVGVGRAPRSSAGSATCTARSACCSGPWSSSAAARCSAAVSTSLPLLIVGRVIQGAGGGIFPLAYGIVRDEFPAEKVAGGIGMLSAILGVGGGLGIVLSGVIVEHLNYHWLFWIPLVVIVLAAVATWRFVPESPVRTPGKVNWLAAALMTVGLSAVLLAISQTTTWGWVSAKTIGLVLVGVLVCARLDRGRGAQSRTADRHDDDAGARRLDHQRGRLPARRRPLRLLHRLPPVRSVAEEHRLRLRRLGRRLRPVPAAGDDRDDDPRPRAPAAIAARFGSRSALLAGTVFADCLVHHARRRPRTSLRAADRRRPARDRHRPLPSPPSAT